MCSPACQTSVATCVNGSCECPGSYRYVTDHCAYCDGFSCDDSSGDTVLVDHELFYQSLLGGGCLGVLEADGGTFQTPGGIWDTDDEPDGISTSSPQALIPGGCDDMGLGPFDGVGDGGMNFAAPGGALTIAQVVAQKPTTPVSVYGVVTALYGWSASPAKSGLVYLQDPVASGPAPASSGVAVYVKDTILQAGAPVGGAPVPQRGAVVEFSDVTWKPYNGVNELVIGGSTALTALGTAPLPPPVPLPTSALGVNGSTSATGYKGMRVTAQQACTMADPCPLAMQYVHP